VAHEMRAASMPTKLVPVDGPTLRPSSADSACMAATESRLGTSSMRSTSVRTKLGSTRGRPMPSMREPGAVSVVSPLRW